ncbi:hypothetical protein PsYK624_127530 [Phanerochaete sordida]|uniref:Transmembrane protein n=1 Tax=Phanerochaete sordida TaxID=48140 RepID=A0A9P3GKR4_9APHY|nr:hypothetical protein PsYK624_127530 [Phanerochaete sordida]
MATGPAPTPKTGGTLVTMALGTAFFVGALGTFYYAQFAAHRRDDQTWIHRHGDQVGDHSPDAPRLVTTGRGGVEPTRESAPRVPLPGNNDNRGSEGVVGGVMSAVAGRGVDPDGKVPEKPNNIQQPAPQRRNEDGSHYTKAGNYAEGYRSRPKDPNHGPEEGRS